MLNENTKLQKNDMQYDQNKAKTSKTKPSIGDLCTCDKNSIRRSGEEKAQNLK